MSKRKRFIISSIICSLGFIGILLLPTNIRFLSIAMRGVLTLVLFGWSLKEGLGINMTLVTLILPCLFTVSVGFFWFLLPKSILTYVIAILIYRFGIYALLLTANIYTVATIRTIALLRAARGVGFVLTLITFFLVFDTIISFRWPVYVSSFFVALLSLPLYLQGFWIITLEKYISKKLIIMTLIASLVMGEIAVSLFFWPATVVVASLFLTVSAYVLLGLGQSDLEDRLFIQTVREYLLVGAAVFVAMDRKSTRL